MADVTNPPVQPPDSGVSPPRAAAGTGFLATTAGKIVVGAVALGVLLGIAGAIVLIFAMGGVRGLTQSGGVELTATASSASVTVPASADTTAAVEPMQKPLSASFTFRNVFAPSIKPPLKAVEPTVAVETAAAPAASSSSADSTSPTVEPQSTLFLTSIVTEGDAHKGVFTLDGVTYTAGNDETIGSSPWKVLMVGLDSVDMLYGDAPVTIVVGTGVTK